ncbi:MAG: OmpA family protein [Saprospiraceae bacterium]
MSYKGYEVRLTIQRVTRWLLLANARHLLWIFALLALSFNTCELRAQTPLLKETFSKKQQKMYAAAEAHARMQEWDAAAATLSELLSNAPNAIDALFFRAQVHTDRAAFDKAENDYEQALQLAPDYFLPAWYLLGITELKQEKYSEALPHFQTWLDKAKPNDRKRATVEKYLEQAKTGALLKANPVPFDPVSLGNKINTPSKEYQPAFTADGQLLIYTVNYAGHEDFYYSSLDESGHWTQGQPLTSINSPLNEGAQSISADGQLLFFTGCNRPDTYGSCDLYYIRRDGNQWGNIHHAATPLNSAYKDTQPSLSANADELWFASDRPGGQGGMDIWYSRRRPDGYWENPINAGSTINTPGNEEAPFLHADGQTLYFMSDGHPGLGDFDLFLSKRHNGQWLPPQNIGYPINTAATEGALVVSTDGQTAYYTTNKNTVAGSSLNLDIYQFPLHQDAQPNPVTYVKGLILDASTQQPVHGAMIVVEGESSSFKRMSASDGSFLVVLPAGTDYPLHITKEGYLFYSDRFELSHGSWAAPFNLDILLQPIAPQQSEKPTQPVVMKNVRFDTGSSALLPSALGELQVLLTLLQQHPQMHIRINGHTDDIGSEADNIALSENRAKAVYDWLIAQGIQPERLQYQGFGDSRPLVPNQDAASRQVNRRTEFEVVHQ